MWSAGRSAQRVKNRKQHPLKIALVVPRAICIFVGTRFVLNRPSMSLQVSQLSKRYGSQKALDEVSFSASPGRILGFLGPNGAGKSTAMKIITGYLAADSGAVSILGENALANPKKLAARVDSWLSQHCS